MEFAAILALHVIPGYQALMENYDKTQGVQKVDCETNLDRESIARVKRCV